MCIPTQQEQAVIDHLSDQMLPSIALAATNGQLINLSQIKTYALVYIYTMTGRPDAAMPHDWDHIPGAHGSTPESCNFRDLYVEFTKKNIEVYGLSTQISEYQAEAKLRLELPFELLSDYKLEFGRALGLPGFETEGLYFHKRISLLIHAGRISKVFYPVHEPDDHAEHILRYLMSHRW